MGMKNEWSLKLVLILFWIRLNNLAEYFIVCSGYKV